MISISEHKQINIDDDGNEEAMRTTTFQFPDNQWEVVRTKDGSYLIRKKIVR
jgi:hypothetical protein